MVSSIPGTGAFRTAVETMEAEQFIALDMPRANRPDDEAAKPYGSIDGDRIPQYLTELTRFSLQSKDDGNVLWGRLAGSVYERRATEYVSSELEKWGLQNVRIEEFPLTGGDWRPTSVSLKVAGINPGDAMPSLATAATAYPSGTTSSDGLSASLEYVGLGAPAGLRGRRTCTRMHDRMRQEG